jgi:hypothetical protein
MQQKWEDWIFELAGLWEEELLNIDQGTKIVRLQCIGEPFNPALLACI